MWTRGGDVQEGFLEEVMFEVRQSLLGVNCGRDGSGVE